METSNSTGSTGFNPLDPNNVSGAGAAGTTGYQGAIVAAQYVRNDGFMVGGVQMNGVRAYDPNIGAWTTPDAYAGEIHDPASQQKYMWNRGNAVDYSDPSGYCAIAQPQTCGPQIVSGATAAIRVVVTAIGGTLVALGGLAVAVASIPGDEPHHDKPHVPLSPEREKHILDGDETGGGHAPGVGNVGKSEFPESWSREKIIREVKGVADDPKIETTEQPNGNLVREGMRDGVKIKVVIKPGAGIWTAYPTGLPRNPR